MADNTQLNPGPGVPVGDVIRTLDRTATGSPKTEVVQLDQGGPDPNAESFVSVVNPLYVTLVNDPHSIVRNQLLAQSLAAAQAAAVGGFFPLEIPPFLGV